MKEMWDVIIVGGGPAGLDAALILGGCQRRVLLCDAGKPHNAASRGLHGFLTRDGITPQELLAMGREQLRKYPTVKFLNIEVIDAQKNKHGFGILQSDGVRAASLFENGPALPRRALFFSPRQFQRSNLPEKLGCAMTAEGEVATGNYEVTNVPGLYVAGNASTSLLQLSIVAAAEGVETAFGINQALRKEDLNK